MGGEPLLNNNCKKYFYITRKYFKNSEIFLITNGILLPKQDEDFWISCKENDIEIRPTKYPIKIDWEYIKNISNKYGVSLYFYNDENIEKQSRKNIFDLSGKMDSFNSLTIIVLYADCAERNYGCQCFLWGKISFYRLEFSLAFIKFSAYSGLGLGNM